MALFDLFANKKQSQILESIRADVEINAQKTQREKEFQAIQSRAFAAAQLSRLTQSWQSTRNEINEELRGDLDKLRERARNLENDNDFMLRWLEMLETNVIGHTGPRLISLVNNRPSEPDNLAREAIENAWDKWCKRGVCEASGQYSFVELCWNIVRGTARDGEYIVDELLGYDNGFGYALRVIDIDTMATWLSRPASAGINAIKLGVEVDQYGKAVNYWFTQGGSGVSRKAVSVSASRIIHRFKVRRAGQVRGTPWAHAAMLSMHYSGEFALSALLAAKYGADNLGFFVSPDGGAPTVGDGTDADGAQIMSSVPGNFFTIPDGYDYRQVDSKYPNEVFDSFMKTAHRRMASGLNVSYPALCNDHADLNYNSIRATQADDRDQFRRMQRAFTESWLDHIFDRWLTYAVTNGAITMPNGSALPVAKLEKFKPRAWQYRGWESNDPLKDMNAAKIAIQELRIDSRTAYAARAGRDLEDVFNELDREEQSDISKPMVEPSAPVILSDTETDDGNSDDLKK